MNRWLRLVRAPAALTVLGDAIAGAAASGALWRPRTILLPLSSAAFYWAGMAINDWADRDLDAVERPERPIPAGEIAPNRALAAGAGLTAAGLALAAAGGGRSALPAAATLAGCIWTYDLVLRSTPLAPLGMAACRGLDVLLGANGPNKHAARGTAGLVAAHACSVTIGSAGEVRGAGRGTAAATLGLTAAVTGAVTTGRRRNPAATFAAVGYALNVGARQAAALATPTAEAFRAATAAGIHGTIALQSALIARSGAPKLAAAVAALQGLASRFGKKVPVT
ncbi:SCO3242 family prenyltransferase [Saccharopolyspora hirsuta]|uniref:SCO3242 family prenyltransferase n=1 Tax=Saccharopolyspora TaxID=1835 RepID=UPI00332E9CFC